MEKISVDKVDKVEKAELMVAFYKELQKAVGNNKQEKKMAEK